MEPPQPGCLICGGAKKKAFYKFCSRACYYKKIVTPSPKALEILRKGRQLAHGELNAQRSERIRQARLGVPRPELRGERNLKWKGGVGTERHQAMGRVEYKIWRATVFKRDRYTCVLCLEPSSKLEAHHIHKWSTAPQLRYDPDNGVTLCAACHRRLHGIDAQFTARFELHTRTRAPIDLTEEEKARLLPFKTLCDHCHTEIVRAPWHKTKKWHFCNVVCKRAYEKRINTNWRTHTKP